MSSPRDTPFTKTNSKSIYGKTPLESWVGTVVAYDSQKEQLKVVGVGDIKLESWVIIQTLIN